jgi:excisionase family DNA binding protein
LGRRDSEKVKHERPMTAIEQSSLPRVEHDARDAAYLQIHPRLQSALLAYKEGLLGYKEALQKFEEGLNGEGPQSLKKGQSLRLLSLQEVCQRLGADRGSIYQLLINGEIPCYKLEDDIKIRQADLEEYMEAG